jgi:hypothetical protein
MKSGEFENPPSAVSLARKQGVKLGTAPRQANHATAATQRGHPAERGEARNAGNLDSGITRDTLVSQRHAVTRSPDITYHPRLRADTVSPARNGITL